MAVDIRATVSCSLGTLISGSISDDYLQGSGLVKTRGSVEISGTITPAIGTVVTFSYVKGGVTRSIPRKLRVLSSFADPFRRTTKVELGCKLTYLSDLKDRINWRAFSDPENSGYSRADTKIVTLPIRASSVAFKCLAQLGIVASSMPLTNSFSVAEFDFGAGYVNVLSDLLVSESYFGYLDANEVLQVRSLAQDAGTGPVFTSADIVDLGPIGVGQLPGEAVTVSYSTLKLKAPTEEEAEASGVPGIGEIPEDETQAEQEAREQEDARLNWEEQTTTGTPQTYYVSYVLASDPDRVQRVRQYTGTSYSISTTTYGVIKVKKQEGESEENTESLSLIGTTASLPELIVIGSTGGLSAEQQAAFESSPVAVLEEEWPNANDYNYVQDGSFDKWVYTGSTWELNAESPAQRFEVDPEAVLAEYWPDAEPYDYVADGTTRWVYTGSGWQEQTEPITEDDLYEEKDVPFSRVTKDYGPSISVATSIAQQRLSAGLDFASESILLGETLETFTYDDKGNQIASVRSRYQSKLAIAAALSLTWADQTGAVSLNGFWGNTYLSGQSLVEQTTQANETIEDYTKDVTTTYRKFHLTQDGQQQIASRSQDADGVADTPAIIEYVMQSGLVLDRSEVTVSRKGVTLGQERPPAALRISAKYAKGTPPAALTAAAPGTTATSGAGDKEEGDPNNGWRTESQSKLQLALGSAAAQRRIELSMPYAPDDIFVGPPGGPFFALRSNAPQKASLFGRVQNRLLLGNRNGVNLQLAPEKLPEAPFDPMYVQANGLTALYRANGNQWAFSSDGIVCSTDALFWAAVGGTGTFWFPVSPGVTTLPTTPPIVEGQMDASTVVLPYNETAVYDAAVRTQLQVASFTYALELLTTVPALVAKVQAEVRKITKVEVPAAAVTLAVGVPVVSGGGSAQVPAAAMTLAAIAPTVSGGGSVAVPSATLTLEALAPEIFGTPSTDVAVPSLDLTLSASAPAISTGTSVAVPAKDTTVAALAPSSVGNYSDPNFASVSLLLHLDGSNGGTTFTDSSSNAVTMTRGGNAALSTGTYKFGTASVEWDGTGDFVRTPSDALFTFGTGDFTIEFWSYFKSTFNTGSAAILMSIGNFRNITYTSNTLRFRSDAGTNLITSSGSLSTQTWYHIALTRSGNDHRLFVDGTQVGSTYTSTSSYTADRITFGANNSGSSNYLGFMDEIRVTKGVARYTANFTAPSAAFFDQ